MILDREEQLGGIGLLIDREALVRGGGEVIAVIEFDGERGALTRAVTGGLNGSAMPVDDGFADGETQAEAGGVSSRRGVTLFEGVENTEEPVWVDADAGVLKLDANGAGAGIAGADVDVGAFGAELDGVLHEVPEHLLEASGIATDLIGGGNQVELKMELF